MRRAFVAIAMSIVSTMLVTACGGGGSTTSSGGGNNPTPATISGVAATGAPVINGTITITGNNGQTATGTTDSVGHYNINVTGLTAPFIINVSFTDPNGIPHTFYSYATADGTVNVNPVTNAAVAIAAGGSTPTTGNVTQPVVDAAISTLQTKLAALLNQYGGNGTSALHPITGSYTLGAGLDAFLDMVTIDVTGATITVKNSFDGSTIGTSSLAGVGNMTIDVSSLPTLSSDITITGMSATSGEAGTHFIISGTGFDPSIPKNYVMVGGIRAMASAVLDSNDNLIGLNVTVPPGCAAAADKVVIITKPLNSSPKMAEAGTFTVTRQYDYIIATAKVVTVNGVPTLAITGYFSAGKTATVTISQNEVAIPPVTVMASQSVVGFTAPGALDISKPYTVTVTIDGKTSNVYTVSPV